MTADPGISGDLPRVALAMRIDEHTDGHTLPFLRSGVTPALFAYGNDLAGQSQAKVRPPCPCDLGCIAPALLVLEPQLPDVR